MAISQVQKKAAIRATDGTSISVTLDSAPTSGNLLIAIGGGGGDIVSSPSGWTLAKKVYSGAGNYDLRFCYWKVSDGSESGAISFSFDSSDSYGLAVFEYSGMASSSPYDVGADAWSAKSDVNSQTTGTTATTSQADELALALMWTWGGDYTPSWTNGFATEVDLYSTAGGDSNIVVGSKTLTATGTQETTVSGFSLDWANGMIVTFKAETATAVGKDLDVQWNVLTTASDTLDIQWALLEIVHGDMFDSIHNVMYFVYPEEQTVWNVLTTASDDLQMVWNVAQPPVGKDIDMQWNVLTTASDDLQMVWNVLDIGVVGNTISALWNVEQSISDTLDMQWNVFTTASDILDVQWSVIALVSDDIQLIWNVLAAPGATPESGFTVDPVNNSSLSKLYLPEPKRVTTKVRRGVLTVSWSGFLWTTTSTSDTIRENLRTIVNDHQIVIINYSFDPTLNGNYWIASGGVRTIKRAQGLYEWTLETIAA